MTFSNNSRKATSASAFREEDPTGSSVLSIYIYLASSQLLITFAFSETFLIAWASSSYPFLFIFYSCIYFVFIFTVSLFKLDVIKSSYGACGVGGLCLSI